jgi:metallo-beta-lactamase family protein
MEIRFLGAANTVTGSQFLLITDRARVLVDCGMFQGGPHEVVRNRVPLAYDPTELDAIVLTHAHLDHCGLIPHIVAEGFGGPVYATRGTAELAALVLLDSGKLQEEYAKRHKHWALKHPDKAAQEDARELARIEAQEQAAEVQDEARPVDAVTGELIGPQMGDQTAGGGVIASGVDELVLRDEQGLGTRMGFPPFGHPNHEAAIAGSPARANLILEEPVYDQAQAATALGRFKAVEYETAVQVAPGITATFHDAGHILGSSIVELNVASGGTTRKLVFSGDLGRANAPILRDPAILTEADYVFIESTYGGRLHEPEEESLKALADAVNDTAAQKGVLLIPSFAIGRTQEVVWALRRLQAAGRIPQLRLFLDSPMASKATTIYEEHRDYYDAESLDLLAHGSGPMAYPDAHETPLPKQSEAIERAHRPYVIVASNGMLTGGRVLNHLRNLVGDTRAMILFVGYQGEGTLGANLQAGVKSARIDGQEFTVHCAVRSISGFSAHADEKGLLDWLRNFVKGRKEGDPGVPRRVFIVHGDPDAQAALEPKIQALGLPTIAPHWHQHVVLD